MATHRTTNDILMGNKPCWTLPKGTKGTPSKDILCPTLFRLDTPIEGIGEYVHLASHHLEIIPS